MGIIDEAIINLVGVWVPVGGECISGALWAPTVQVKNLIDDGAVIGTLEIEFVKGGYHRYPGVSLGEFVGLVRAASSGGYFNANIKGREHEVGASVKTRGAGVIRHTAPVEVVQSVGSVVNSIVPGGGQ